MTNRTTIATTLYSKRGSLTTSTSPDASSKTWEFKDRLIQVRVDDNKRKGAFWLSDIKVSLVRVNKSSADCNTQLYSTISFNIGAKNDLRDWFPWGPQIDIAYRHRENGVLYVWRIWTVSKPGFTHANLETRATNFTDRCLKSSSVSFTSPLFDIDIYKQTNNIFLFVPRHEATEC